MLDGSEGIEVGDMTVLDMDDWRKDAVAVVVVCGALAVVVNGTRNTWEVGSLNAGNLLPGIDTWFIATPVAGTKDPLDGVAGRYGAF